MSYESMIEKLQAVQKTTKSTSNKLLLMSCINELQELHLQQKAAEVAKKVFHVTQRLKFDPVAVEKLFGVGLTKEGLEQRFLVNTIDEENKLVWVIDATGNERPQWLAMDLLIPENE